jgi:hypothetical protein
MSKPKFVELPGSSVYCPPFMMEGCQARVFIFRTKDRQALRATIKQSLNLPINDVFEYVPLEWVMLITMSIEKTYSIPQKELGFSEEQDVGFCVPLAAFRKGAGAARVVDHFAICFPFLLVQNPIPMTTGREVYGFQKMLGTFAYLPNTRIPIAASAMVVSNSEFLSEKSTWQQVMRIDDLVDDLALAPGHSVIADFEHALASELEKVESFLDQLVDRLEEDILLTLPEVRKLFAEIVVFFNKHRQINVAFLRQLRDISDPTRVAYQAVVESPMRVTQMADLTLLPNPTLKLFQFRSYPVARTLGLQDTMTPLYSFQLSTSFEQDEGRVIAESDCCDRVVAKVSGR